MCDYPDAYEGQPGFDFIQIVSTTWDKTRVIEAKMGEFIVIARRKGKDWYWGSINNSIAMEITIPLSFLAGSQITAKIFRDGKNPKASPNEVIIESKWSNHRID